MRSYRRGSLLMTSGWIICRYIVGSNSNYAINGGGGGGGGSKGPPDNRHM